MALLGEALLSLLLALPVWVAGTVVFDGVHWVLHVFLRTRSRLLRALAWPHVVHHQFLDERLRIHPERQRANIFCHLVPEYLTQLAFTASLLLLLPRSVVAATALLQTAVFALLLRARGLDINHRPIEVLDAHGPSFWALPAYHALHHVYPDAYYSAYTKVVDYAVGGGIELRGRRFGVAGATSPLGRALVERLRREPISSLAEIERPDERELEHVDVLLLCDPGLDEVPFVEALASAARDRQLPPEAWVVRTRRRGDSTARHYDRDPRVIHRTIAVSPADLRDPRRADRRAAIALFFVRRGFHYVPTSLRTALAYLAFRRTGPERPVAAPRVRHRAELRPA